MAQAKKPTRHRSAIKAYRQSLRRRERNLAQKKEIRLAVRAVTGAASAKDSGKVALTLASAYAAIDKAARRGTIHWKTAARKKSRLTQRAQAPAQPAAKA